MIPIYVISLERSTKRREQVLKQWAENGVTNIEWIRGVDGNSNLDSYDIDRRKFHRFWHNPISCCSYNIYYSNNEYGCALSHISVYQKIVDENIPYAIVLEDDSLINPKYKEIIYNLDNLLKERDIEVLFLFSFDKLNSFSKLEPFYKSEEGNEVFIKRIGVPGWDWLFNRRKVVYMASAYVISNKGAKKLLEKAFPVRLQADRLLGLIAYNKLKAYKLSPNITFISGEPTTIPLTEELKIKNAKPWYSRLAKKIKNIYHK